MATHGRYVGRRRASWCASWCASASASWCASWCASASALDCVIRAVGSFGRLIHAPNATRKLRLAAQSQASREQPNGIEYFICSSYRGWLRIGGRLSRVRVGLAVLPFECPAVRLFDCSNVRLFDCWAQSARRIRSVPTRSRSSAFGRVSAHKLGALCKLVPPTSRRANKRAANNNTHTLGRPGESRKPLIRALAFECFELLMH